MTDEQAIKAMLKVGNSNKNIHFEVLHNIRNPKVEGNKYLTMMMKITPSMYRKLLSLSDSKHHSNYVSSAKD